MLTKSKALLWMCSKPGTSVHAPGKTNDASRASVPPSLRSDCRYCRHPVPAVAGRDARRCLLPQRGRRLLCRQYSAPCRGWVRAGGVWGGRGAARPVPELGAGRCRLPGPCSASAVQICARFPPASGCHSCAAGRESLGSVTCWCFLCSAHSFTASV